MRSCLQTNATKFLFSADANIAPVKSDVHWDGHTPPFVASSSEIMPVAADIIRTLHNNGRVFGDDIVAIKDDAFTMIRCSVHISSSASAKA